jgi:hypothetical protein
MQILAIKSLTPHSSHYQDLEPLPIGGSCACPTSSIWRLIICTRVRSTRLLVNPNSVVFPVIQRDSLEPIILQSCHADGRPQISPTMPTTVANIPLDTHIGNNRKFGIGNLMGFVWLLTEIVPSWWSSSISTGTDRGVEVDTFGLLGWSYECWLMCCWNWRERQRLYIGNFSICESCI